MDASTPKRLLSGLDHARLSSFLFKPRFATTLPAGLADAVQDLLDGADSIDATRMPPEVVTMRSRVRVRGGNGDERTLTLCYPAEADPALGLVSVFSPLGLALLGARVGQRIAWTGPREEPRTALVLKLLYQPESSGDYAC